MKPHPQMNRWGIVPSRRAFTLIELLVAMAIAVLLMMTAIPYFRTARKSALVRATNDLLEAFQQARVKAILTAHAMQVVIFVDDGGTGIGVESVPNLSPTERFVSESDAEVAETSEVAGLAKESGAAFTARLDDEVAFSRLLINGRSVDSADQAAVIRFFPNGTSDALEAELQWLRQDVRRISLDIMTGQPEVRGMQ
jgi:prepilin-type N-terminal cleavage/methylation domain-containing protein